MISIREFKSLYNATRGNELLVSLGRGTQPDKIMDTPENTDEYAKKGHDTSNEPRRCCFVYAHVEKQVHGSAPASATSRLYEFFRRFQIQNSAPQCLFTTALTVPTELK